MRCLPSSVFPLTLGIALVTAVWVVWASSRDPETLWAPGNVSRYHREVAQCMHCHEPFRGPLTSKCLACHSVDHFTTHSTPPVRDVHIDTVRSRASCLRCHTEHRGVFAPITIGVLDNPHGEFVFRATGTRYCADCHAVPREKTGRPAVLDNATVRHLMKKGEGAHRPGAFAHCVHCHTGGKVDLDHDD